MTISDIRFYMDVYAHENGYTIADGRTSIEFFSEKACRSLLYYDLKQFIDGISCSRVFPVVNNPDYICIKKFLDKIFKKKGNASALDDHMTEEIRSCFYSNYVDFRTLMTNRKLTHQEVTDVIHKIISICAFDLLKSPTVDEFSNALDSCGYIHNSESIDHYSSFVRAVFEQRYQSIKKFMQKTDPAVEALMSKNMSATKEWAETVVKIVRDADKKKSM